MREYMETFLNYQRDIKKKSNNTLISFNCDLSKMADFFEQAGNTDVKKVNETQLNSYLLYLERQSLSSATISRYISSMKAFFDFLLRTRLIETDPCEQFKAPKIIRKIPDILTVEQVDLLLDQPDVTTNIGLRDKAMLELLYATGIKVSELASLKITNIDINLGIITCTSNGRERNIPMGRPAVNALREYIKKSRLCFLQSLRAEIPNDDDSHRWLFMNYVGSQMSRQGFWKLIRKYGEKAGIKEEITPQLLRHSFAVHMIQNGADLKTLQEILGHSDVAVTEMYSSFTDHKTREIYKNSHPRS